MFFRFLGSALCALFAAVGAGAQGIVDEYVTANSVRLEISLPNAIAATVAVEFASVDGLEAGVLGASVQLVDPTDATLLARLPAGGLVSIPGAFPVKLSLQPDPSGDLLFRGPAVVSFYTQNLHYVPGTPLRLFKAEHGGAFRDITDRMSSGSYRVRGTGGEFSEFMIVADLRPVAGVALAKLDALDSLLTQHQGLIDAALLTTLTGYASTIRSGLVADDFAGTLASLGQFEATLHKCKGGEMPDAWRPRGDLTNVAGALHAAAASLRFSLSLLANGL